MTGTNRKAGERPAHVKPPAHLSKSPPVPDPDPLTPSEDIAKTKGPTRYGDWVHKGIAVDF
ncbi:DUF1674 domain-containing protein [Parasphingorhabdus sp.]|uniref:DUF1674 domain-containing protein n=1 Tax=Parasphingorhabdus sp. TaxID=2709688 RepID=UPI0007F33266|nr:hypothetical protein A8B75_14845 [Sphingomonadales bacterium EhC05]